MKSWFFLSQNWTPNYNCFRISVKKGIGNVRLFWYKLYQKSFQSCCGNFVKQIIESQNIECFTLQYNSLSHSFIYIYQLKREVIIILNSKQKIKNAIEHTGIISIISFFNMYVSNFIFLFFFSSRFTNVSSIHLFEFVSDIFNFLKTYSNTINGTELKSTSRYE